MGREEVITYLLFCFISTDGDSSYHLGTISLHKGPLWERGSNALIMTWVFGTRLYYNNIDLQASAVPKYHLMLETQFLMIASSIVLPEIMDPKDSQRQ